MDSVFLVSDFAENFFSGYPHNNAFADGGRALILGQLSATEASLWQLDPGSRERREICRFPREMLTEKLLWCDVAYDTGRVVTVADEAVWVVDPTTDAGPPRLVYRAPKEHRLHPIPAIRGDGRRILCALYGPDINRILALDPETGASEVLLEKTWWLDHLHYCPFDPEWIGFSHEGLCSQVRDRVWGWHPVHAPAGRCFFDQMPDDPKHTLYAGHERWSFHDRSVLVVGYGEGPGTPRGIYEAFVDGRPQRLVSEGNRDLHVNVSRDGRWVVVDTTGPYDLPGKGWEDAQERSDILFIDRQTGERRFAAHTRITKHPSHPHPVFSPDGRCVYFNEAEANGLRNRVWCALNPFTA